MHERLASLVGVVTALIDELEAGDLPYAFGGAIALSAWSEPRATTDVDVTVWAAEADLGRMLASLATAGVVIDAATAAHDAAERGLVVGRHGLYRVDIFTPSIPFYDAVLTRRRRVRLADRDTWVLSAECLAVFKLLFNRPKDLVDVGRMLEVTGAGFDRAYVRAWLCEIVGEDDARVRRWDELVSTLGTA